MSAKQKALGAIEATNPELIPVVELAKFLDRRRQEPEAAPPKPQAIVQENTVVIPPPEHPLLVKFGKDVVRVSNRKGVRIVTIEPAAGLTARETMAVLVLMGLGYGVYEAAKLAKEAVNAIEHPTFHLFPPGIY